MDRWLERRKDEKEETHQNMDQKGFCQTNYFFWQNVGQGLIQRWELKVQSHNGREPDTNRHSVLNMKIHVKQEGAGSNYPGRVDMLVML